MAIKIIGVIFELLGRWAFTFETGQKALPTRRPRPRPGWSGR